MVRQTAEQEKLPMLKLISSAMIAASALTLAACNVQATTDSSEPPARIAAEVIEAPTVTDTRCFVRVKVGDKRILVDYRRPPNGSILQSQTRNFELCQQARAGDTIALDPAIAGG